MQIKRQKMRYRALYQGILMATGLVLGTLASAAQPSQNIQAAVESSLRTATNVERDQYRHPVETLTFFEIEKDDHVVEIWPGRGWYSEVLAGLLKTEGKLYAAHFAANSDVKYFQRSRQNFEARVAAESELFGEVELTEFHPPSKVSAGPAASADHVLTFRNVHNWMKAGYAEAAFEEFFQLLKPGGILGVVEHRAKPGTSLEDMIKSGYVTEEKVVQLATAAGFTLEAKSEVNANAKDSTVHPRGVWTLPPSLRLGDDQRSKYLAVGESDRMTLKFRKP